MPEHRKGGHGPSIKGEALVPLPRVPTGNGASLVGVVLGKSLGKVKTSMLSISRNKAVGSEEARASLSPSFCFKSFFGV